LPWPQPETEFPEAAAWEAWPELQLGSDIFQFCTGRVTFISWLFPPALGVGSECRWVYLRHHSHPEHLRTGDIFFRAEWFLAEQLAGNLLKHSGE
jgi:hypothetical protein